MFSYKEHLSGGVSNTTLTLYKVVSTNPFFRQIVQSQDHVIFSLLVYFSPWHHSLPQLLMQLFQLLPLELPIMELGMEETSSLKRCNETFPFSFLSTFIHSTAFFSLVIYHLLKKVFIPILKFFFTFLIPFIAKVEVISSILELEAFSRSEADSSKILSAFLSFSEILSWVLFSNHLELSWKL